MAFLPTHCGCRGLLLHLITLRYTHTQCHTHTHTRQDSSGRVIIPTQRTLTTHNTHNRQTTMSPAGFEPEIPASEQPQTHAFDRAATGIDHSCQCDWKRTVTAQRHTTCPRRRDTLVTVQFEYHHVNGRKSTSGSKVQPLINGSCKLWSISDHHYRDVLRATRPVRK